MRESLRTPRKMGGRVEGSQAATLGEGVDRGRTALRLCAESCLLKSLRAVTKPPIQLVLCKGVCKTSIPSRRAPHDEARSRGGSCRRSESWGVTGLSPDGARATVQIVLIELQERVEVAHIFLRLVESLENLTAFICRCVDRRERCRTAREIWQCLLPIS